MLFQPAGAVGTLEPLASYTTTCAMSTSPAWTAAGKPMGTAVSGAGASANGPSPTKLNGIGVALGVAICVAVAVGIPVWVAVMVAVGIAATVAVALGVAITSFPGTSKMVCAVITGMAPEKVLEAI